MNDRTDISQGLANVYLLFKQAGIDTELHIYAATGHGFGVNPKSTGTSAQWTTHFRTWLDAKGFLRP